MSIQFSCSQCQKKMQAPDGTEGKKARCPACSAITRIPDVAVAAAVPVVKEAASPFEPPAGDNPFQAPATTDFSSPVRRREHQGRYSPTWEDEPSLGNFFKSTKEI